MISVEEKEEQKKALIEQVQQSEPDPVKVEKTEDGKTIYHYDPAKYACPLISSCLLAYDNSVEDLPMSTCRLRTSLRTCHQAKRASYSATGRAIPRERSCAKTGPTPRTGR